MDTKLFYFCFLLYEKKCMHCKNYYEDNCIWKCYISLAELYEYNKYKEIGHSGSHQYDSAYDYKLNKIAISLISWFILQSKMLQSFTVCSKIYICSR